MIEIISTAKVIICVGSGGVGKTTLASTIAAKAAQMGKNVLVLTIDPAQRLKSTLNLQSSLEREIVHNSFKGKMFASLIDAKEVFDNFVKKASEQSGSVEKILQNKLYVQLTTTLSGSQEFTSLEKLYSTVESGKYDLVVLDTPPTKHAIDFLHAPQKLAALFNDKVAEWFRTTTDKKQNLFKKMLFSGTHQVMKALENLTGSAFMKELSDFFQSIHKWQFQLEKRIHEMHRLLVSPNTHFCLVTSFDEAKMKEAEQFAKEIRKGGYNLSCIFINRAYPIGIDFNLEIKKQSDLTQLYCSFQKLFLEREQNFNKFSIQMNSSNSVFRLPELTNTVSDLEGVIQLTQYMGKLK